MMALPVLNYPTRLPARSRWTKVIIFGAIGVAAALLTLWVLTPVTHVQQTARALRISNEQNLVSIAACLSEYHRTHGRLPAKLTELRTQCNLADHVLYSPLTYTTAGGDLYEYRPGAWNTKRVMVFSPHYQFEEQSHVLLGDGRVVRRSMQSISDAISESDR
jgi:hypothetical protein